MPQSTSPPSPHILQRLPLELVELALAHLDTAELHRLSLVDKFWREQSLPHLFHTLRFRAYESLRVSEAIPRAVVGPCRRVDLTWWIASSDHNYGSDFERLYELLEAIPSLRSLTIRTFAFDESWQIEEDVNEHKQHCRQFFEMLGRLSFAPQLIGLDLLSRSRCPVVPSLETGTTRFLHAMRDAGLPISPRLRIETQYEDPECASRDLAFFAGRSNSLIYGLRARICRLPTFSLPLCTYLYLWNIDMDEHKTKYGAGLNALLNGMPALATLRVDEVFPGNTPPELSRRHHSKAGLATLRELEWDGAGCLGWLETRSELPSLATIRWTCEVEIDDFSASAFSKALNSCKLPSLSNVVLKVREALYPDEDSAVGPRMSELASLPSGMDLKLAYTVEIERLEAEDKDEELITSDSEVQQAQ